MPPEFHFIRPYWLIMVIPLIILVWILAKRNLINEHWESVCDSALLPYILVGRTGAKKYTHISLFVRIFVNDLCPRWTKLGTLT